jgi:integron integrase
MMPVPVDLLEAYKVALRQRRIRENLVSHYVRWLRFYLDFCGKYKFPPRSKSSVPEFMKKLRDKNQEEWKRKQAEEAVTIYLDLVVGKEDEKAVHESRAQESEKRETNLGKAPSADDQRKRATERLDESRGRGPEERRDTGPQKSVEVRRSETNTAYRIDKTVRPRASKERRLPVQDESEAAPARGVPADWTDLYARLREEILVRHYSPKTLKSYTGWARKFQSFVRNGNPSELTVEDAKAFFTFLAVERNVSASSQNLAFNSLLFLFRHVLKQDFGKVEGVVRAKQRPYIPVVLSREEVDRLIAHLPVPCARVAKLLYGCGLRLFECLKLRVQDVSFDLGVLTVHDGKGKKDRTLPLPEVLLPELRAQLDDVIRTHRADVAVGYAGTFLPNRLEQKYNSAARELAWQWSFPATKLTLVPRSRELRRYHLHESVLQKAIKKAVWEAKIPKHATAHTLRHSYASHLLQANYDIRTIQKLLGHSDVRTTMIYTHTVPSTTPKEAKSPLDL